MDWITEPFTRTDGVNTLTDSISLPKEQYDAMSKEEIEALKDQIFENWLLIIKGEE